MRRVRYTALPENQDWQDTGCEGAPACLKCPLPLCQYDQPRTLTSIGKRDARIWELHMAGMPNRDIKRALGVSYRQLNRIVARGGPSQPALAAMKMDDGHPSISPLSFPERIRKPEPWPRLPFPAPVRHGEASRGSKR